MAKPSKKSAKALRLTCIQNDFCRKICSQPYAINKFLTFAKKTQTYYKG